MVGFCRRYPSDAFFNCIYDELTARLRRAVSPTKFKFKLNSISDDVRQNGCISRQNGCFSTIQKVDARGRCRAFQKAAGTAPCSPGLALNPQVIKQGSQLETILEPYSYHIYELTVRLRRAVSPTTVSMKLKNPFHLYLVT